MSMSGSIGQAYARYRRAAGLTQERAAELLGCSVRALASWESGQYNAPDEKVSLMVDVYQAPTLAVEHLRAVSATARHLIPQVDTATLAEAALQVIMGIKEFALDEADLTLMQIAADGKVDDEEREALGRVIGRLDDIVSAAYALRLCCLGGGTQ